MIVTIDTEKDGIKEFRAALNLLKVLLDEAEKNTVKAAPSESISDEGAVAFGNLFGNDENGRLGSEQEKRDDKGEVAPEKVFLEPY